MDRKIRLLFDANPLVRQKTGVGFYTDGLIRALAEIPELEITGHYFRTRGAAPALPSHPNLRFSSNSWLVGQAVKLLRKFRIRLPWELLAGCRADVLFFPDFTTWPSLFGAPKILTIHDLTFIDHPEYVSQRNLRYLRRFVKRDAQRAALILTISEFSKHRIIEAFKIPAKKVLVIPVPPPPVVTAKKNTEFPAKYILYLGTLEPRKNIRRLAEAYSLLPAKIKDGYSLILAGGQGWKIEDTMSYIKQLQADGDDIKLMGYVDDPTRAALYKQASLVVVPSIYEGFGIPILEAMTYGAPAAVSDIEVFKEIAGDAAAYFDPNSAESISRSMEKLLSSPDLRQRLVRRGAKQLKKYSWKIVASDVCKHIERLVEAK